MNESESRVAALFSMTGRRALVTGGSVSIGRAIALAFADAGADIAIHHSQAADDAFGKPDAASEVAALVRQRGRRCAVVEADFGKPGEGTRTVAEARKALGGVDVLVVCASIQYRTPFEQVTPEQTDRQVQINFKATIELLQAALPPMKERGFGRVVTIGSINETTPEPALSVYAALKCAQHNLAINVARQYAPFGVTVNNLSPGLIATERNRWRREDADAWAAIERNSSPMGRAGTPDEIASAALLLCSDAGSFITGADLQVNGGRHLYDGNLNLGSGNPATSTSTAKSAPAAG
ncbi:MAG: SDR family NAD(P)-dependent oxidoreductase [Burkholderiales bacterium]